MTAGPGQDAIAVSAPAKVNLFLNVLAREDSGFHQLETLFTALEFGDRVVLRMRPEGLRLELNGPWSVDQEENLAYRAAQAFLASGGVETGVEIRLEKAVPPGAGLGGGSSDAAATLKAMDSLFPGRVAKAALEEIGASLGSDVPFFLSPTPLALAWGRGERLCALPPPPPAPVLLALPPLEVSTAQAFAALDADRSARGEVRTPRFYSEGAFESWVSLARFVGNEFESVVFRRHPRLEEIKNALLDSGPRFAVLSGSGSALYALYDGFEAARRARRDLAERLPDVSFVLTRTLGRFPGPIRVSWG